MREKSCEIPAGTYHGAVASIDVTPEIIMYRPFNAPSLNLEFDWNCNPGEYMDVEKEGKMGVIQKPSNYKNEQKTLTRLEIFPDKRNDEFPCVEDTSFWFYDGVYDGDESTLSCPNERDAKRDGKKIINRYRELLDQGNLRLGESRE